MQGRRLVGWFTNQEKTMTKEEFNRHMREGRIIEGEELEQALKEFDENVKRYYANEPKEE